MLPQTVTFFVQGPPTRSQLSLPDYTSVASLKEKLYTVTGITPGSQVLTCEETPLLKDDATLGVCGLDGHTLVVSTTDAALLHSLKSYTDAEDIEKFELTEQEYDARRDTVRAYKRRMGLGRFAPDASTSVQPEDEPLPERIRIEDRCQDGAGRRGTVRFIGHIPELSPSKNTSLPVWVGVEWDEPVLRAQASAVSSIQPTLSDVSTASRSATNSNKSNGSVKGVEYFNCKEGYGSFVRPDKLEVGQQFAKEIWEDELDDL